MNVTLRIAMKLEPHGEDSKVATKLRKQFPFRVVMTVFSQAQVTIVEEEDIATSPLGALNQLTNFLWRNRVQLAKYLEEAGK